MEGQKEKVEHISTFTGIMTVVQTSWMPVLGVIFHPMYTIVNAAACGRIGNTELAGFGLGSLTLGIMAISIGTMFAITV